MPCPMIMMSMGLLWAAKHGTKKQSVKAKYKKHFCHSGKAIAAIYLQCHPERACKTPPLRGTAQGLQASGQEGATEAATLTRASRPDAQHCHCSLRLFTK